MARLLCLNPTKRIVKEVKCSELKDFYEHLECDCFDIAHLNIGGKYFDCFVDDNGLFRDNPVPCAIDSQANTLLVGNVIFANHNSAGETTDLSDADIDLIKKNIVNLVMVDIVDEAGTEKVTRVMAVLASY